MANMIIINNVTIESTIELVKASNNASFELAKAIYDLTVNQGLSHEEIIKKINKEVCADILNENKTKKLSASIKYLIDNKVDFDEKSFKYSADKILDIQSAKKKGCKKSFSELYKMTSANIRKLGNNASNENCKESANNESDSKESANKESATPTHVIIIDGVEYPCNDSQFDEIKNVLGIES